METLFAQEPWAQYGIVGLFAGTMLAAQIWSMRYLITVTLPAMIANFREELAHERERRHQQQQDSRTDHERVYQRISQGEGLLEEAVRDGYQRVFERVERAEQIFANSLQANRHRLGGMEAALTTVAEMLKSWREELRGLHADHEEILRILREERLRKSGPRSDPPAGGG